MKRNKIDPDKVTFGTYYQAFLISKKHNAALEKNVATGGSNQPKIPTVQKKESYLRYTPEDFQKRLREFESKEKMHFEEEEKSNWKSV